MCRMNMLLITTLLIMEFVFIAFRGNAISPTLASMLLGAATGAGCAIRSRFTKTIVLLAIGCALIMAWHIIFTADLVLSALLAILAFQTGCVMAEYLRSRRMEPTADLRESGWLRYLPASAIAMVFFAFKGGYPVPLLVSGGAGTAMLFVTVLLVDAGDHRDWMRRENPVTARARRHRWLVLILLTSIILALATLITPGLYAGWKTIEHVSFSQLRHRSEGKRHQVVRSRAPQASTAQPAERTKFTLETGADIGIPEFILRFHDDSHIRKERIYVRLTAYDTFHNGMWTNSTYREVTRYDADDGRRDGRISLSASIGQAIPYTIYSQPLPGLRLPCLAGTAALYLPSIVEAAEGTFRAPITNLPFRFALVALAQPAIWETCDTNNLAVAEMPARYLAASDTASDAYWQNRASTITGKENNAGIIVDQLLAYSRTISNIPSSASAADDSRFDSYHANAYGTNGIKATALVFMLRSRGIPARYAVGFCPSGYNYKDDIYLFDYNDPHAWAEISVKDIGWVVVDPDTPPPPAVVLFDADSPPLALENYPDLARLMSSLSISAFASRLRALLGFSPILSLCLVVFIAVLFIIRQQRRRMTTNVEHYHGIHGKGRTPDFFLMFCRHFAWHGVPYRVGLTPLEYLALLKRHNLVAEEWDDIIQYLYNIAYRKQPRHFLFEFRTKMRIWRLSHAHETRTD